MSFLEQVRVRATATRRRIVFPETADERTLRAVAELSRQGVVRPVLLLDPEFPDSHSRVRALEREGAEVIDVAGDPRVEKTAAQLLDARRAKGLTEEHREQIVRRSALRRLAEVDDVAAAVEYLLSDGAGSVTGTVMTVDAGSTA